MTKEARARDAARAGPQSLPITAFRSGGGTRLVFPAGPRGDLEAATGPDGALVFLVPAEVPCRSCGDFFSSSLMALVDPGPEGVGGRLLSLEQAGENLLCAECVADRDVRGPSGPEAIG